MMTISKDLKTKGNISFLFALFHNALCFLMCLVCKGNMLVIKYLFLCHNFFSHIMQKKKGGGTSQIKTTNNFWDIFINKYTTLDEFTTLDVLVLFFLLHVKVTYMYYNRKCLWSVLLKMIPAVMYLQHFTRHCSKI